MNLLKGQYSCQPNDVEFSGFILHHISGLGQRSTEWEELDTVSQDPWQLNVVSKARHGISISQCQSGKSDSQLLRPTPLLLLFFRINRLALTFSKHRAVIIYRVSTSLNRSKFISDSFSVSPLLSYGSSTSPFYYDFLCFCLLISLCVCGFSSAEDNFSD